LRDELQNLSLRCVGSVRTPDLFYPSGVAGNGLRKI
jgi:hypothetical protein